MSSTDRQEVLRTKCTCGRGEYVVEHCSPDHPYGGGYWYEAEIACADCSAKFILDVQDKKVLRVAKSEIKAKDEAMKQWHAKLREVEAHADASGHYDALARWLTSFRTTAAAFRATRGLVMNESESTFRKRFAPNSQWVKRNITQENLSAALSKIGITDAKLDALVTDAQALWTRGNRPAKVIERIYG